MREKTHPEEPLCRSMLIRLLPFHSGCNFCTDAPRPNTG